MTDKSELVRHGGFTRVTLLLDNCTGFLIDAEHCDKVVRDLIRDSEMTVLVGTAMPYGSPKGSGYQMMLTLAESFVIIETWPEIGRAKVIVDLCDFTRDNYNRAIKLAEDIAALFGYSEDGTVIMHENIDDDEGVLIDKKTLAERLERYA